ncbi:MAG: hypothetical protein KC656_03270 [Myxococcales bacterium]|nr:hypothetical protein [Myxococcales bacterium]MCB9669620.1 hypothetical protein [Alphaproteobacteria bacterium]
MEILLTVGLFGLAMAGLSIGVILSDRELTGSCGGAARLEEEGHGSCSACGRKAADVCPTDAELVRIAQLGHPNPAHHR